MPDSDVVQSVRPYILVTMGKSEKSAVPKHIKVGLVVCLHHVAADTFIFTNIAYIIL